MLSVTAIAGLEAPTHLHPIAQLGDAHALTKSDIRMLTKFFGLETVAMTPSNHPQSCANVLISLVADRPDLKTKRGRLIYCKTQTHNTFPEQDWLCNAAHVAGLTEWETTTLSMNHCAGSLSALHLIHQMGELDPVIILAGEKCFHSSAAKQSGAALGEMFVAALLEQGGLLKDFVIEVLQEFSLSAADVDLVVPYNLNLPVLREIALTHG